jgi:palmitoyl-protein thioesterase
MKERMMALDKIRFVKWESDSVIIPRDSSHMSVFDDLYNVIPLQEQALWKEDWIGLRNMTERGDCDFHTIPGNHMDYDHSTLDEIVIPVLQDEE